MEGVLKLEDIPPFSVYEVGGSSETDASTNKFTEIFEKALPEYMFMGMSPDEFWNGDCTLVRSYREKFEMQREYDNFKAWLQGMYIYDAIGRLAPIFNSFNNEKPETYIEEPYPIKKGTSTEASNDTDIVDRKRMEKAKQYMETIASHLNSSF